MIVRTFMKLFKFSETASTGKASAALASASHVALPGQLPPTSDKLSS
jgi:hypothetical protein